MQGGQPMLTISIQPPVVAAGVTAKFESGGTTVQSPNLPAAPTAPVFGQTTQTRPPQPPAAPPASVLWPGLLARTTVTVQPENAQPLAIGRDGCQRRSKITSVGRSKNASRPCFGAS
jgi:hypothetical protein